jgi:hypothetical protein
LQPPSRHGWLSETTLRRTRRPTARGAQVLAREGVLADYCADLLAAFTALGHSKDAKHMSVLEKRLASRLAEETLRAKSFRAQQQAESWAEQRARKAQRVQEALAEAPWEAVPRSRPGTAHSHGALVEDETDGAAVLHFRIFACWHFRCVSDLVLFSLRRTPAGFRHSRGAAVSACAARP